MKDFQFVTEEEIKRRFPEAKIKNACIKHIDLNLIGHFGNLVTLDIPVVCGGEFWRPFGFINYTRGVGNVIRTLFFLLNIGEEDGSRLSDYLDMPCRMIEHNGEIVGLGHYMDDRFMLKDDLSGWLKEVENQEW